MKYTSGGGGTLAATGAPAAASPRARPHRLGTGGPRGRSLGRRGDSGWRGRGPSSGLLGAGSGLGAAGSGPELGPEVGAAVGERDGAGWRRARVAAGFGDGTGRRRGPAGQSGPEVGAAAGLEVEACGRSGGGGLEA